MSAKTYLALGQLEARIITFHRLFSIIEEGELTNPPAALRSSLSQGSHGPLIFDLRGEHVEVSVFLQQFPTRLFYACEENGRHHYFFLTEEGTFRDAHPDDIMRPLKAIAEGHPNILPN